MFYVVCVYVVVCSVCFFVLPVQIAESPQEKEHKKNEKNKDEVDKIVEEIINNNEFETSSGAR